MSKHIVAFLFIASLVCGSIFVGITSSQSAPGDQKTEEALKQVKQLIDVYNTIQSEYVDADKINGEDLMLATITRIVKYVDPHGQYFTPEEAQSISNLDDIVTARAGLILDSTGSQIYVVAPIQGSQGWTSGMLPGDLITRIDKETLLDATLYQVYAMFEGAPGTPLELDTWREWLDPKTRKMEKVTLERSMNLGESVTGRVVDGKYGYIRISHTTAETGAKVSELVSSLTAQGATEGFILDLRYCAFGANKDGITIADCFLEKDKIITYLQDRIDQQRQEFRASGKSTTTAPMIVMINNGTAGPAEIVAAALSESSRAVLIGPRGTRTAGRTVETSIVPLEHGGALRLTTEEYLTPAGNALQGKGITPDAVVEIARDQMRLMLKEGFFGVTREELQAQTPASATAEVALENPEIPDPIDVAEVFETPEEQEEKAAKDAKKYDVEIQHAIDLLSTAKIFARAKTLEQSQP